MDPDCLGQSWLLVPVLSANGPNTSNNQSPSACRPMRRPQPCKSCLTLGEGRAPPGELSNEEAATAVLQAPFPAPLEVL